MKKLIAYFYLGLLVIQFIPLFVNSVEAPGTKNLGWRLLDNGDVFHMWNKHDSYYFDTDSGIQFTNHYDEYWAKNIMMLGYYNGGSWNLLFRNDELTGFSYNLYTTDTYINVTLWKDLSYGPYDFRFAIRYHLGMDDLNLTVVPYIKNLGISIPYDMGFGWELQDIHVGNTYLDNFIYLVNESYDLHNTVDKLYTNNSGYTIATSKYDLYLDWDAALDYKLQVKTRAGEYNAPITLFVRIGTLGVGQEKYTSMYWHDSELTLRPNAQGSKNENLHSGTSIPEATNYQQVDETSKDDDGTYVYIGGGGSGYYIDLYNVPDHTTEFGIINDVTVYFYGRKSAGSGAEGRPVIRTHSTEYTGGSMNTLASSYTLYSYQWDTNPYTSANWTWTEIDNLEIGVQLYHNAGTARCTQVYAVVDYDSFPVVTTNATTNTEENNVTLNGWIEENNSKLVWVRFEYGTTTSYGTNTSNQSGLVEGDTFSAVIGGLTPGTLYHYRSYINDSDNNNDTGADMTFTTKPEGPTSMSITNHSTYLDISWTKGTGADRTTLYRKVDSTPASVGDGTLMYNGTSNNYKDYDLTADTHYYYRAWSWTTDKHSDNSSGVNDTSQSDASSNVTFYGDVTLYVNNGLVEISFVDSGISMDYLEFDTSNNYTLFENHNLTFSNSNTLQINVSELYSGSTVSVGDTAIRFNATCSSGNVNFNYTRQHSGNCYYDVYIDSVLTYDDITSKSFNFPVSSWSTKDIEIKMVSDTSGVTPDPPYDGSSFYDNSSNTLYMFWSRGNYSDQEVVVRKTGSYPTNPDDGTVVQNNSNTNYNAVTFSSGYHSVWSFNATNLTFSNTKLDIPWGAMGITLRNESNNAQITSFALLISNADGTETYYNGSCTGTHYLDMLQIPYGSGTIFTVSSTGYNNRTYNKDLVVNTWYNYTFYLPPVSGGSGPGDPSASSHLYYARVIDERNEPIDDALVIINREINGSYVEIGSSYTDGNGDASFTLFPEITYLVNISKSGYLSSTGNEWTTDPDHYGIYYPKYFKLYYTETSFPNETLPDDVLSLSVTLETRMTITYLDSNSNTTDVNIIVYEINGTTGESTKVGWYNITGSNGFTINETDCGFTINQSNCYQVVAFINHSVFGAIQYPPGGIIVCGSGRPGTGTTTKNRVDILFDNNFGGNPFGWSNTCVFFILMAISFGWDERNAGIGLIITGGVLLLVNHIIFTGDIFSSSIIPVLFIGLGVLSQWRNQRKEESRI